MDKTHFSGFFLEFSAFYYTSTSGALPFKDLFRKEPFKYMGDLWIHSTYIAWKRSSEFEFCGEFGTSRDFFCEQIWSCALRLVQWLGWVFETQKRKKERPASNEHNNPPHFEMPNNLPCFLQIFSMTLANQTGLPWPLITKPPVS